LAPSYAVAEHFEREDTPAWLAAAESYFDQQQADLLRFEQSKRRRNATKAEEAYYAGVRQALEEARAVINQHAEQTL
jgi:hypothetical protein